MTKKEEILNNLSEWSLDADGKFQSTLTVELNQEDAKEVRRAMIELIKKSPSQWGIFDYEEETLGDSGIVRVRKGYFAQDRAENAKEITYFQDGFTKEEQKEIRDMPQIKKTIVPKQYFEEKKGFFADIDWKFVGWTSGIIVISIIALMFLYRWIKSLLPSN